MALPFNLNSILDSASLIEGFNIIKNTFPVESRFSERTITYSDAVHEALSDVIQDFEDWPEDQGFGSSDMTFARKYFIDSMISIAGLHNEYKTDFQPFLKVVNK
jgi:hypothetical protein